MLDPRLFTPLPPAERRALGERYLAFVRERDGEPDLAHRTLARRECWFAEFRSNPPPPWTGFQTALISEPPLTVSVGLISLRGRYLTPAAASMMALIQEEAKNVES